MSNITNIEIKARCQNPEGVHELLKGLNADYRGLDHQIDTYFNCPTGRLKLRAGNIENSLIFYNRSNQEGPKESDIALTKLPKDTAIRLVLEKSYGIKVEIDKERHIYFIENVKFHIDEVQGLGSFMEIEAIDRDGSIGIQKLNSQCEHYMEVLGIDKSDLVDCSYSDLLLSERSKPR